MKLRVNYENQVVYYNLTTEETEGLWVSLSLEGEGLSQKEKEQIIQDTWDEQCNKPDYNNWHKHQQRNGPYHGQGYENDDDGDSIEAGGTWCEPLLSEVRDSRIYRKDEIERARQWDYEDVCSWIRSTLAKKPEWAEAFIAVRIDGESIRSYAARVGDSENNITQKLSRAAKKLKENYSSKP